MAARRIGFSAMPAPKPMNSMPGRTSTRKLASSGARMNSASPMASISKPAASGVRMPKRITSFADRPREHTAMMRLVGRKAVPICSGEYPSTSCMYNAEMKNQANMAAAHNPPATAATLRLRMRKNASGISGARTRVSMATKVAMWMHLGPIFEWTWKILQWPVVFALASAGIALVYYYAPDAEQDWVWLTPGSIFATTLWLLASLAFKYYVVNISDYAATYGAIGGVMVLMLWFYISGTVILMGAEMNAEIEHASPYGKEPGEKVPGQRRKIGPAAMRAWIAKRRKHGEKPPSADEVKKAVGPSASALPSHSSG